MTRSRFGAVLIIIVGLVVAVLGVAVPTAQAAPGPVITAMTPPAGRTSGGDPVTLKGSGLAGATAVYFGAVKSTHITLDTGTHLRVRTPAHSAGMKYVRVVTGNGTSVKTARARYTYTAPPAPLSWSKPRAVDRNSGALSDISCVSASFCMAVDRVYAAGFDGTSWSQPTRLAGGSLLELDSVSCASSTLCVAVGFQAGIAFSWVYDHGTWGAEQKLTGNDTLGFDDVSCAPGTTFCLAVGSTVGMYSYDAGTWTKLDTPVHHATAVSCTSRTFCALRVTSAGALGTGLAIYNGTTVGTATDILPGALLSCASERFCAAVSTGARAPHGGDYSIFDGTSWSTPQSGASGVHPTDLSCTVPHSCVLVDNGRAPGESAASSTEFDGSRWNAGQPIDPNAGLVTVSCWGRGACLTGDPFGDTYTVADSSPAGRALPYTGYLSDVSCGSTSLCMAVDDSGNAVRYDGTGWSAPTPIDHDHALRAVSCPTASFCMAVDEPSDQDGALPDADGRAVRFDGTSWSKPQVIDPGVSSHSGLTDVSCASASFCVAVDVLGRAITYRDGTWGAPTTAIKGGFTALSCPAADFCMATSGRRVSYFDGSTWSAPRAVYPRLAEPDVSCADAAFCAIGGDVRIRSENLLGHAISPKAADGRLGEDLNLACGSPSFCLAGSPLVYHETTDSYTDGQTYAFDGSSWAPARIRFTGAIPACATETFCVAVSQYGEDANWGLR